MYDQFPWIKFTVLSLPFMALMLFMADGLKWKILFTLAVPIGVSLALMGKTLGRGHSVGGL